MYWVIAPNNTKHYLGEESPNTSDSLNG